MDLDKVTELMSQKVFMDLSMLNFLSYDNLMNLPVRTVEHMIKLKEKMSKNDPLGGLGGLGGTLQNLLGARR